jgi:hypothetical protein
MLFVDLADSFRPFLSLLSSRCSSLQCFYEGNRIHKTSSSSFNPGECTLHTRICGLGVGLFFLVERCSVLLLHESKACYYPSLYLDSNGESGAAYRGQNRPMFLSRKRVRKLTELYLSGGIPIEIARKRASADQIIRQNWF